MMMDAKSLRTIGLVLAALGFVIGLLLAALDVIPFWGALVCAVAVPVAVCVFVMIVLILAWMASGSH